MQAAAELALRDFFPKGISGAEEGVPCTKSPRIVQVRPCRGDY